MWRTKFGQLLLFSAGIFGFFSSSLTQAQVVPDRSLNNESSLVINDVMVKEAKASLIEGGAIRDRNLFHSFTELSINDGDRVYFANPEGITNIITRITGNNISEIFGTLGVDGAANLWLLNPNGIVFGLNATLDVNGSFLATTADSYIFDNGFAYTATNPAVPPLLTINIPLGLQFGETAEPIINQSIAFDPLSEFPRGLQVPPQETIAFVGGELNLIGGRISAPQGNIKLGSVAENSFVSIEPTPQGWKLDYQETSSFQDINLTDEALIDASGNGAGNIQLQGKNILLQDGSGIVNNTLGTESGGKISLVASDNLELMLVNSELASFIFANVIPEATGNGADMTIKAQNLFLQDGTQIRAGTFGAGDSGDLMIQASDIKLISVSNLTGIFTSAESNSTGKGGNLTIKTDRLLLRDEAQIASGTFGAGDSGDLLIQASDIELISVSNSDFPTGIFTSVLPEATGKGGNLTIKTDRLLLQDGAQIAAGTFGAGDSGDLLIQASDIELIGVFNSDFPTGIFTSVLPEATGKGGNLTIKTDRLLLQDGAQIASGTFGAGDSGDLLIQASDIELISVSNLTGISTSVLPGATGKGGNLTIETDRLLLRDEAQIASGTFGVGDSGDLLIRASDIELISVSNSTFPTGIFTSAESNSTANAGDLTIETNNLSLQNGGQITSETFGMGNSGDVMIRASESLTINGTITVLSPENEPTVFSSGIFANARPDAVGNSGSVRIETNELQMTNSGKISVSNLGSGNSGDLSITANQLNLDSSGAIEAIVNVGDRGNINLTANNIFLRNNSQITAQAIGTATGGNILINNRDNLVLQNNSQIIADAIQGNGGNITITTQGLFVDFESSISVSSQFGLDGDIRIDTLNSDRQIELTPLPINPINATQQLSFGCGVGNDFALSGKGGLPENPTQTLRNPTVWQDTRLINRDATNNQGANPNIKRRLLPQTPILEAQAWKVNHRGKIELFATTANSHFFPNFSNCAQNPE